MLTRRTYRTFGEVKQATWTRPNGKKLEVAVKIIPKRLVKSKPQVVYDEMDVLKDLNNKHIVQIFDWFEWVYIKYRSVILLPF